MDKQLLNQAASQIQRNEDKPAKPYAQLNPEAEKLVGDLFKSLMAIKPAWRQIIPTDKDLQTQKAMFIRGFVENGICTPEQVAHGVRKARKDPSDFFPSVGKFISWCQLDPQELGLPDLESAYQEAASKCRSPSKKPWSHAAVYHAGKTVGWFELGSNTREKTFPAFKTAYSNICERVLKGEEFKLPDRFDNTKLEKHSNGKKVITEESKAVGREALSDLKNVMGI